MQLDALMQALSDAPPDGGVWPFPATRVERIQTHISVLFLLDGHVFKLKKPLDLGFLDASTLELRAALCAAELQVNRRLAPGVYLGLSAVQRAADGGLRVTPPREPEDWSAAERAEVVEWAVCMRRLPAERMLDALLERGLVDEPLIERLAQLLSKFHAEADAGPAVARFGEPEVIAGNARENFTQLEPFVGALVPTDLQRFLRERCERALAELAPLFRARLAGGRIREGHGDLHAGNICCLDDRLVVYDAIEFNERFRCGDVAADLAFLAMDLDERGAADAGRQLVQRYAQLAEDSDLARLLPFYKTYRAVVRAKVAAFATSETELGPAVREAKRAECLDYLRLACRYELESAGHPGAAGLCGDAVDAAVAERS